MDRPGHSPKSQRRVSLMRRFFDSEASGGMILMGVTVVALVIANSPVAGTYFAVLKTYVLGLSVLHWINDALMAVFFLLVGLEIKREMLDGQLSTWPRRILPGIAAVGGMVVPALIYLAITWNEPRLHSGWAIPTATDIAFALGVLAVLGSRVPTSLKIFLTALAILDDLGAIIIIAFFYTGDLSLPMLGAAALCLVVLIAFNRFHVTALLPYLVVGAVLWFFVLKSGIHATLAGVALALTIPLQALPKKTRAEDSSLHRLEHALQPWVAYAIIPIFGFANAGVPLSGLSFDSLSSPLPLGIALGLFVGKQLGVFVFSELAIRLNFADMPAGASRAQCYGVALLCGIGFTMSLFIGALAFPGQEDLMNATKIGVLMGSALSALAGYLVLSLAPREQPHARAARSM
ncbi:Na+/H+ antiporter NhaA [Microvirga tunisiensis]|uniref:Na(+)/H(+) antiporter NhaA n=1 Tax=Microvirga tunisiensis TaxID=2108360 RepID=A0A5N7MMX2_9HYPH|nr:Na+/H+ antiporter NhaA [Microvirga tunisiensis]MPR09605.1 Na+/H+ antiporter NhaA [Microvirga tunisiensis]MPR27789.1 Na+/H+ antiporter NhaA [Microvirga tunisiensis]